MRICVYAYVSIFQGSPQASTCHILHCHCSFKFSGAKVECDDAMEKFIFIAFFIARQKQPANLDKQREINFFKKDSAIEFNMFYRTFCRILRVFTPYLQ